MKEEIFYVGVNSPKEVRKSVLESMKEIIMVTKVYDSVKSRRMEKASKIVNLQNLVKEIDLLFSKLNRVMPKSGVRIKAQPVHTTHPNYNRTHQTSKYFNPNMGSNTNNSNYKNNSHSSHINEVNKLSRELEEIESSLSRLG